ncbi:MAG: hypothetical protein FK734_20850 [Asgard group archaeon]|nr:hypothetical protein [Asgard group archaeon]
MKDHIEIINDIQDSIVYGNTIEYFLLRNKQLYKDDLEELLEKDFTEIIDSEFDVICIESKIEFGDIPFIMEIKGSGGEIVYINDIEFKGAISARKINTTLPLKVNSAIEVYWNDRIDVLDTRNRVFNGEEKEDRIEEILAGPMKIN